MSPLAGEGGNLALIDGAAEESATAAAGGLQMTFRDPDSPQALLRFFRSFSQAA